MIQASANKIEKQTNKQTKRKQAKTNLKENTFLHLPCLIFIEITQALFASFVYQIENYEDPLNVLTEIGGQNAEWQVISYWDQCVWYQEDRMVGCKRVEPVCVVPSRKPFCNRKKNVYSYYNNEILTMTGKFRKQGADNQSSHTVPNKQINKQTNKQTGPSSLSKQNKN